MGLIYLDPSSWVKHSALDTLQEESAEHAQMLMVSSDHRLLRAAQHEGCTHLILRQATQSPYKFY